MKKQHIILLIRVIGIIICFISLIGILFEQTTKHHAAEYYSEFSQNIITQETPSQEISFHLNNNKKEKKKKNQNIKEATSSEQPENSIENNYIYIKDTNICYPLVQGTDNQYYLTHLPNGDYSSGGSIFMDYQNKENDFNTIIYGHNMKNDTMFGQLSDYYTVDNFAKNHSEMILNWNGNHQIYQLFSVQYAEYTSDVYFINPDNKEQWIDDQKINSIIDFQIDATINDTFVTLSTCGNTSTEKVVTVWKKI